MSAEGLAFLISAMSRIGPGPARAARKSRTGGTAAAWASSSSRGCRRRAASTSLRFEATISSRIVIFISCLDPCTIRPSPYPCAHGSNDATAASGSRVMLSKVEMRMRIRANLTQACRVEREGRVTDRPWAVLQSRETLWEILRAPVLGLIGHNLWKIDVCEIPSTRYRSRSRRPP